MRSISNNFTITSKHFNHEKDFDAPPGPADPNIVANTSIAALKALHTSSGAYDIITSDLVISGVVVANDRSGNLYKQLYIQDSTGGLQILLDAPGLYGTYPVGRRIFIRCKDLCISDYNGTMQLGVKAFVSGANSMEAIPGSLINKHIVGGSINNPVVPKVVTVSQLGTGLQDKYIGSLIQLDNFAFANLNVTYSDTSVYKNTTNRDVKNCPADGNNTIIVRTSAYANFAGQRVAQGRGSLIAIYTVFGSTKQLIIRDTNDVKFTNPYACALPPGTLFSEDFESIGANNLTLNLPGWKNIGEVGGVAYQNAVFGPVKCAKISAFNTGVSAVTSWLITPSISLTGATAPKLSFTNAAGFNSGTVSFKVMVSTNYTGTNTPSTATWTELPATYVTAPASGYSSFISSGQINLAAYAGQNVHIGFRYQGGDPSGSTTWEIDDVKVMAQ
ncbi:MAG: DUF5017 domain-containing protein [Sphingobacteriales bacterium]|nr:MAG: DUF5017 domain-containing protein [Sphingobacteriales bacterium]